VKGGKISKHSYLISLELSYRKAWIRIHMDPHSIDILDPNTHWAFGRDLDPQKNWPDVRLTDNEVSSVLWAVLWVASEDLVSICISKCRSGVCIWSGVKSEDIGKHNRPGGGGEYFLTNVQTGNQKGGKMWKKKKDGEKFRRFMHTVKKDRLWGQEARGINDCLYKVYKRIFLRLS
jgi:hypothetical protein